MPSACVHLDLRLCVANTSHAGDMKFAAGNGGLVLGFLLAWVGCSQAFVAPPVTGEIPS